MKFTTSSNVDFMLQQKQQKQQQNSALQQRQMNSSCFSSSPLPLGMSFVLSRRRQEIVPLVLSPQQFVFVPNNTTTTMKLKQHDANANNVIMATSSNDYYQTLVPWTYADVLPFMGASPLQIMMFHAPVTGFYAGSIGGTVLGTVIGGIRLLFGGLGRKPMLQTIGMGSTVGALGGMVLGGALLYQTSLQGENTRTGVPWNEEGITDRAERVQKNDLVRAIDFGGGTGLLLAAGAIASGLLKKPKPFQAMTLGSAVGAFASSLVVTQQMKKPQEKK